MGAEGGEAQWKRRFRSHGCGIETIPGVHPWKLLSLDYSKLNSKLLRGVGRGEHNTDLFRRAVVFWCYNSVYVF